MPSHVIVNKLGLHARAAAKLVHMASRFQSAITVARDVFGSRDEEGIEEVQLRSSEQHALVWL